MLYPPLLSPGLFRSGPHGEDVVCVCRIEHHKRQHLLIEAMKYVRSGVRLRLCGSSASMPYIASLREQIAEAALADRVVLDARWISEEEKAALLGTALASAYVPFDEDSYGYPTIEAAQAERCTVTLTDSGGTGEFVQHGVNGLVVEPEPRAIAAAFDSLHADRTHAARLGRAARERLDAMDISWDTVVARLLS